MKSKEIKLQTLIGLNACKDQVDLFKEIFGDSVELTEELAKEIGSKFDIDWAVKNLLIAQAKTSYFKSTDNFNKTFRESIYHFDKTYKEELAPLRKKYERAVHPFREILNKDIAPFEDILKKIASLKNRHYEELALLRKNMML